MRPGDLVEFKAGLFGIQPPNNLGIYLERVKRKGAFFVVLHTLRGKQEVKSENVTGRRLQARLAPDELEGGDLGPRLKQLIEEVTKGKVKDEARAEGASDRDLWQKVKDAEGAPLAPDDIAGAFFATKTPTRSQVGEIKKILESCREPGVGYFERQLGREERWRPIARAEHVSFHKEKDGLARLRNKLVLVEEVEDEETGYLRTVYRGVPVAEAALDDEDRARLAFVADAMKDFVLHDRFTGRATLGASGKHTLDGFSLFPWLKFLALDWTGSERVSISSTFVEFLVDVDLLGVDDAVELVARRKVLENPNFGWEVRDDATRAAERASPDVEVGPHRRDLRHLVCYTIDPPDARDHDDAVGVEWHENGDATLWVHIADVSHYVTPESTLDHDARKRATSVYLPTGVLPMLPPRLSNDLCSLEPQKDRYAMTARMRFDGEGRLLEEEAMESVIRVRENVPYGEALRRMQEEPEGEFALMRRLADRLDAHRRNLAIETSERRIRLTPENVEHVEKMGTPATRLIETFMVAANECVARILTKEKVPLLYRCHPLPDRASIERFNAQCETMGVPLRIVPPEPKEKAEPKQELSLLDALKKGGKVDLLSGGFALQDEEEAPPEEDAPPAPALVGLAQLPPEEQEAWLTPFRQALAGVRDIQDPALQGLVFVKTLGTMGRAFYTPANLGHFGLGSVCYCHFTSPIRRYPDLVVHRQLRWLLRGRQGPMPHDVASLDILAAHASEQAAAAEGLERGVVDSAMVFASREERWAGAQRALVNGITRGGAFMSMEGGLEARVATADIPGGPYSVDDFDSMLFVSSLERAQMREEVTAKNWRELVDPATEEVRLVRVRLGDRVSIVISNRDYVEGRVAAKLLE
ncbi:MAG TPA: ribonuclease R family protein [Candidatus Thermoplasmatota archaeon]|nr:ribonuclease R family protein [Candidatus Thermoplasmatota archaeon]